jgi:hypothetical protein
MGRSAAHRRPCEAARRIVDIDDQFARDDAIGESDNSRPLFEARVRNEPSREAGMQGADIANRRPNFLGPNIDPKFPSYRRHL